MENYKELEKKMLGLESHEQTDSKKLHRRTFNVDDDIYNLLCIYAEKQKISRSKAINQILEKFFNSLFEEE